MNELNEDYYWYDKDTDEVVKVNKNQYREFFKKNNDMILKIIREI